MANDVLELYNLALDTIGARGQISSPLENSREAEACQLWFPNIRDQVLASAAWPEATSMARLAQTEQQDETTWQAGDPRPDLSTGFALPPDLVRPQYISGFGQFAIQGRTLMTNLPTPVLIYTYRNEDVGSWSPELQMAIMRGLAASLCVPLTGKSSRAKILLDQANSSITSARESAANTGNESLEWLPDWLRARGYYNASYYNACTGSQFFYPYGSLLQLPYVN